MKANKIFFIASIILATSFSLHSQSFSLQLFQKNSISENVYDSSRLIEQCVLDYFFDNGYIASNNPIFISSTEKADKDEMMSSMADAKDGSLELYIKLSVFFSNKKLEKSDGMQIDKITWSIFSLKNNSEIASGEEKPKADSIKDSQDVIIFANKVAWQISKDMGNKGW